MSHPLFSFVEHDVTYSLDMQVDQIYHLACPASPPQYQKDPVYTIKTCFLGTMHMLELAKKNNAKFLQASTSEVYGDPEVHPQPESYRGKVNPIGIRSCYDEWKRISETLCMEYRQQYAVDTKIARIFNTYGPFMDPNDGRVISNFIVQALQDKPLTIYGEGKQTRSFQYVDDLVAGLVAMMASHEPWPINIGTQYEYTMLALAQKILQHIPESTSVLVYYPLPGDDPKQRRADNTLAYDRLWRKPSVALDEGLQKTIAYFRTKL